MIVRYAYLLEKGFASTFVLALLRVGGPQEAMVQGLGFTNMTKGIVLYSLIEPL